MIKLGVGFFCKKALVEVGHDCWKTLYKDVADDDEVLERANRRIIDILVTNPFNGPSAAAHMLSPDQFTGTLAAGRWVDQGLPVFRLGHKRIAALMATHTPIELVHMVKPPFKAFFIELPSELLYLTEEDGTTKTMATGIIVHATYYEKADYGIADNRTKKLLWNWMVVTGTKLVQWQINRTTSELCTIGALRHDNHFGDAFSMELTDYDHRITDLVNRFICALCLLVTGHKDEVREKREKPVEKGKKLRMKNAPEFRVFTMGSNVSVDARAALREYLEGRRSTSPSVQFLVRGHWRNQAHGLAMALRKLKWIEPFWKGPDGAIIASKAYEASEERA